MKTSEAFPSKYLKADDIQRDTPVTIDSVEIEEVGQGDDQESKPIVRFKELEKGLVLNVTNSMVIEEMYGDEMDSWVGRRITLYATKVQFGKKMVMAVRVRSGQPSGNGAGQGSDPAAELRTTMNTAWAEFQLSHTGKTKDEIAPLWKAAIHSYFNGRPHTTLGAAEWKAFVKDRFIKQVPNPIENEPPHFTESDIPF